MTTTTQGMTVGKVAALAGVTIRTLHHYEQIGLLVPSGRSAAGYRMYTDPDCDRLARILYYRELGFSLDEVRTMLDDHDPFAHLERQHQLLQDRLARVQRMVTALEREMEAYQMNYNLTPEEKLDVFGEFDPAAHEQEARDRWGDSDAWRDSRARASRYTKVDWDRIKAAMADLNTRMVAAMQAGESPGSPVAMDLAEEHRQQISANFYDCSLEMHRGLADLYVSDPRFTANIDAAGEGLATWLHDAILANAGRSKEEIGNRK